MNTSPAMRSGTHRWRSPRKRPSLHQQPDVLALTTQIVAAHVGRNQLPLSDLPKLIGEVYRSLPGPRLVANAPAEARLEPAVAIKKSVTPEYIVCLEDGRKLKMLKRHLMAAYSMSPRAVSRALGASCGLPDGGARLRQAPQQAGQGYRPRQVAQPRARVR